MFKSSYIPRYFTSKELVSPEFYEIWREDSINLFDPHVLRMLDSIRRDFGEPITINSYPSYTESGLRNPGTSTGATRSKHKRGVAFDLKAKNIQALQDFIALHSNTYFLSRVENFDHTPTWCHIEISTDFVEETKFFNP